MDIKPKICTDLLDKRTCINMRESTNSICKDNDLHERALFCHSHKNMAPVSKGSQGAASLNALSDA